MTLEQVKIQKQRKRDLHYVDRTSTLGSELFQEVLLLTALIHYRGLDIWGLEFFAYLELGPQNA